MTPLQFEDPTQGEDAAAIKKLLKTILKLLQEPQAGEYLTRTEVAKLLKVDISTIHNWSKAGVLQPIGKGGRVYFRLSEIDASFIRL